MEISEQYLLGFGFKKIEVHYSEDVDVSYELETKDVYFVYSTDWSLSISDSKDSYKNTPNYIVLDTHLTDKVCLWENIFKSLTGAEFILLRDAEFGF